MRICRAHRGGMTMRRKAMGIAVTILAAFAIIVDVFVLFFKPSMQAAVAEDSNANAQSGTSTSSSPSA